MADNPVNPEVPSAAEVVAGATQLQEGKDPQSGITPPPSSTPPKQRKKRGSDVRLRYGTRSMKAYPITETELNELFQIGIFATLAFSLSAGCFGFTINIIKDISINNSESEIAELWGHISAFSLIGGVIFLLIGWLLIRHGKSKISQIKIDTKFPDED